jgi:thiol-disulfide isomerase/thioredoxin
MIKKSIFTILLALMFILQGCSSDKAKNKTEPSQKDNYILTSIQNKKLVVNNKDKDFILKGADGKVVIYDIFATWCPPCRKATTHLNSLQKKYKDDLVVIGITIEDNIDNEKLQNFKKAFDVNYTLVNSKNNRLLADKIVDSLKLGDRYPIPVMALYKDGKYITHYIGSIEEEFIESDIKRALGK